MLDQYFTGIETRKVPHYQIVLLMNKILVIMFQMKLIFI